MVVMFYHANAFIYISRFPAGFQSEQFTNKGQAID